MIWVSLRAPLEMRLDTHPSIQAMKPTTEASNSTMTSQPLAFMAAASRTTAMTR